MKFVRVATHARLGDPRGRGEAIFLLCLAEKQKTERKEGPKRKVGLGSGRCAAQA
jgi:hypothetical protein